MSVFLDVDESICEKNYLINQASSGDDNIEKLLQQNGIGQLPAKLVRPSPGFCVKTRQVDTNKKIFINVCYTDDLPAPKDITEDELCEILGSDEICDFRVPMSIGDLRNDSDKKGEDAIVCDVAISTEFYRKIEKYESFKQFFIAVAFEGFMEKYKMKANDERIVLKNKKAVGALQTHRIQQREIDRKMGVGEKLPSFDQMLNKGGVQPKIMEICDSSTRNTPNYRLFRKKNDKDVLHAEIYLPYLISSKDLTLDIGEDRILLESSRHKYFLDIFHRFKIDQSSCASYFNTNTKILSITMPIVV